MGNDTGPGRSTMQDPPAPPQYAPSPMPTTPPRGRWPWVLGIGCLILLCACAAVSVLFGGVMGSIFGTFIGAAQRTTETMKTVTARDYPGFEQTSVKVVAEGGPELWVVRLTSSQRPNFRIQRTYTRAGDDSSPAAFSTDDEFFRRTGRDFEISEGFAARFTADHGSERRVVLSVTEARAGETSDRLFQVATISEDASIAPSYDSSDVERFRYAYRRSKQDWVEVVY
jgi:hypothetical protein